MKVVIVPQKVTPEGAVDGDRIELTWPDGWRVPVVGERITHGIQRFEVKSVQFILGTDGDFVRLGAVER